MSKKELGKIGEKYACDFLIKEGYNILEKNIRLCIGEIDIVAKEKNNMIVFVEVKTLSGFYPNGFCPEDHMTTAKMNKYSKMALLYANMHPELIMNEVGYRIDLIALSAVGNDFIAHHYKNIC